MTEGGAGLRDTAALPRPTGVPPDAPPHYAIHAGDKGVAKRWRDLTCRACRQTHAQPAPAVPFFRWPRIRSRSCFARIRLRMR